MFQGRVRSTVELTYVVDGEAETRDLAITFGLIDKISKEVDWAAIPEKLGEGKRPLTEIANLVALCMVEAGFKLSDNDIDDIYDGLLSSDKVQASFTTVAMEIINAFMPQGKKKQQAASTRKRKKAKS